MLIKDLNNKRILLWGLGKEGQACLTCLYQKITATWSVYCDNNNNYSELDFLKNYPEVTQISKLALDQIDVIIKSPGISYYRPEVQAALEAGIQITSGTNIWFAERANQKVIGITGSKGKSTTSSLMAHLLSNLGQSVILAGNIGQPLISFLDQKYSPDYWVLELSSYQLTDFIGLLDAAILLNLYPEHLDWHKNITNYFKDKSKIVSCIKPQGSLVTSSELANTIPKPSCQNIKYYNNDEIKITERTVTWQETTINVPEDLLPGRHNLYNAAAAMLIGRELGFTPNQLLPALLSFKPLPHRLQPIGTVNGVLYVNDSISTIPESAVAAVNSFANRSLVLILGGLLRDQNWAERAEKLFQSHVKHVICIGENRKHILSCLVKTEYKAEQLHECTTLEQAVPLAAKLTRSGDVVLLSPGSASYDQFKNFEARGHAFEQIILRQINLSTFNE